MIIIPAQLEAVTTRKDKTLKLTFGTNELSPSQASELFTIAPSIPASTSLLPSPNSRAKCCLVR